MLNQFSYFQNSEVWWLFRPWWLPGCNFLTARAVQSSLWITLYHLWINAWGIYYMDSCQNLIMFLKKHPLEIQICLYCLLIVLQNTCLTSSGSTTPTGTIMFFTISIINYIPHTTNTKIAYNPKFKFVAMNMYTPCSPNIFDATQSLTDGGY